VAGWHPEPPRPERSLAPRTERNASRNTGRLPTRSPSASEPERVAARIGLAALAVEYYDRFRVPLLLSETSRVAAHGGEWLDEQWRECAVPAAHRVGAGGRRAAARGTPRRLARRCHSERSGRRPRSRGIALIPAEGLVPLPGRGRNQDADYADCAEERRFSLYQENCYSRAAELPDRGILRNRRNLRPSASGLLRSS
jgi:hypothetical protein